jgi:hypothetical protein
VVRLSNRGRGENRRGFYGFTVRKVRRYREVSPVQGDRKVSVFRQSVNRRQAPLRAVQGLGSLLHLPGFGPVALTTSGVARDATAVAEAALVGERAQYTLQGGLV